MPVDDAAARKSNLSETKKALLAKLLSKSVERLPDKTAPQAGSDRNSIPRRPSGPSAPLSFAQQRLWFLDQLNPRTAAYNMPAALRLNGKLSVSALSETLGEIGRRHEALRTTFGVASGRPAQFISPISRVTIGHTDLSRLDAVERNLVAEALIDAETNRPFDLIAGPLFRALLLRLGVDETILVVTMHHIISDGWSLGILVHEISSLYNAFANGSASPLNELQIQYADFSVWQRKWLQGRVLEEQLLYWKEQLQGAPELTELPADRHRSAVQSYRGAVIPIEVPSVDRNALAALTSANSATLFMGLLAAFQVLLFRYSGRSDVVVGSPIANRNRREIEGLIGFFVNTLAYRAVLSGNPGFRTLLDQVKETTLRAYAHQDLPFERVVEELHPDRNASYNPVFQVSIALQNAPIGELELRNLMLAPQPFSVSSTRFDLEFHMWDHPDCLRGSVIFAVDLFDATTVARMIGHFRNVLSAVTADSSIPIGQVELLAEPERRQLLTEFNATEARYAERGLVHQLTDAWGARTPDSVAVSDGARHLSFGKLNDRANGIASRLRDRGAGADSTVGVLMSRSVDWVCVLLGVLKAGAGYASFDPSYPKDRIAYMVEDCGTAIVVADSEHAHLLDEASPAIVNPVSKSPAVSAYRGDNPENRADREGVSYVVYTSGSTGKPKGVVTSHGSLLNLVLSHCARYSVTPKDRASQIARCGFDAASWEIWPYLISGACVLLTDEETRISPPELRRWLIRNQITIGWLPPALAEPIFQEEGVDELKMRIMFSGSDRVTLRPPAGSTFEYVNAYGPSEAAVIVTAGTVMPESKSASAPDIGRALPNSQIYILDPELQPAPLGVPGELCISGANLARGYLFRPDLTGERFVPNPHSGVGARMYRTGDLARYFADGTIDFLGRIDNQIKLRGFRIELGEIESALSECPLVREAVVVADGDRGEKSLIAYVAAGVADSDHGELELLERDHVSHWQTLYDQTYSQPVDGDPDFNVIGWNSSYSGTPISEGEMREWRDSTVAEILRGDPKRILELGCGTGLLLLKLAPERDEYWGVDFSAVSLDYVRRQLQRSGANADNIKLLQKSADDFEGIPAGYFDAVILNSVIQYFPGCEYLLSVLRGAVKALRPGGFVFVGDVRNLDLLEAFHTSLLLETSPESLTAPEMLAKIQQSTAREEELLVSPRFFRTLAHAIPAISGVETLLKRGQHQNELTKYRYNVILNVGSNHSSSAAEATFDWQRESMSPESLRGLLASRTYESLLIQDVPNSRVIGEIEALRFIGSGSDQLAAQLRQSAAEAASAACDPQEICRIGEDLSYQARLYMSDSLDNTYFDVSFARPGTALGPSHAKAGAGPEPLRGRTLNSYVNNPLQGKIAAWLVRRLKGFLSDRLPDYMVPPELVVLDRLPRNANGKVDRKSLRRPSGNAADLASGYLAPVGLDEELIAGVFEKLLGLDKVSTRDNFFDIGGHSLRATQAVSAIRDILRVEIPLADFFGDPTVAGLAVKVTEARRAGSGTSLPTIQPVVRNELAPLSFAQQRLWFIDQLAPGTPVYNIPLAVRIKGNASPHALMQAMSDVVRRHESLRTTFKERDGGPQQLIYPHSRTNPELAALSNLSGSELHSEARRLASAERDRPFDLNLGPLARFQLLPLDRSEYVVLITMHHIISDGWSVNVLMGEISKTYEAFAAGAPSTLREPVIQYADFCCWQREWIDAGIIDRQIAFWKENIGDSPAVVEIPTDKPRPPAQSFSGGWLPVSIPRNIASSVREFARMQGATVFMVLLAAFQALLHRYSGEQTIIVGTPVAGRNRAELEGLIGFFVNTLILKADVTDRGDFRGLVDQVREFALGAYSNQDVPFEKLVEELHPKRDMSRNPLFQIMMALQTIPAAQEVQLGLQFGAQESDSSTAMFDLDMQLFENERGFAGTVTYATDLYDQSTVHRLLSHYVTLLDRAVRDSQCRIEDLPWMTESEALQSTGLWRGEQIPSSGSLLHELIETQVRQTPDAIAVASGEHFCSYSALERLAGNVAGALCLHGIGIESRVGIFVRRGIPMVATLLGVLKTGAAYVPLDPAYPEERMLYIIRDSGIGVLISEHGLPDCPSGGDVQTLFIEDVIGRDADVDSPPVGTDPGNLAYAIYTSGSTGTPKGVAIEHRSAVALLVWARTLFSAQELSGVLASTSMCFDLSIFELFAPLACGGAVIVAENALEIPELAIKHSATLINTVPSAMVELLRCGGLPGSVVTVNLAGEPLSADLVDQIYERSRAARVYNLYGPTEDTTYSTFAMIEYAGADRPAVGRPISNSEAYVLQSGFHASPPGITGGIFLAGDGLARGYLGRPDLTAEAFLPAPARGSNGERMYRTGDLGRFREGGELEFLGRADHQIKIRGFRIELGEIEAALRDNPAVRDSVALVVQTSDRNQIIVAYTVCKDESGISTAQLKNFLAARLPAFMVPASIGILDQLPLTPNGKVNRKALAEGGDWRAGQTAFVPPASKMERLIAGIWEDALGIKPIGIDHNFFDLGGHSLLAVRVLSRLRQATGSAIPLAAIFQAPTIGMLAHMLEDGTSRIAASVLTEIQHGKERPRLFLVPGAGGSAGDFAHFARALGSDQPVWGFHSDGLSAGDVSIERIAQTYADEVLTLQPTGPYLIGGWSLGALVAFEMARQLHSLKKTIGLLVVLDMIAPSEECLGLFSAGRDTNPAARLAAVANEITRGSARATAEELERLSRQEMLTLLTDRISSSYALTEIPQDLISDWLSGYADRVVAAASYRPAPYPGPLVLFRAEQLITDDPAYAARLASIGPSLGWEHLSDRSVEVYVADGSHYTMLEPPFVEKLGGQVRTIIDRATSRSSAGSSGS
jgi:amino acid adenylation domain-containing protein